MPHSVVVVLVVRTQESHFGRKTNEIAKFGILDEKRNAQFWMNVDEKWPIDRGKNCQILSH